MQSFLQKTVEHLCEKYGSDIGNLCIVLPNRRAGLFLKTHFAKRIGKTFWAPDIMATEDFVALLSELEIPDTITLIFELYETVKKLNPETESFDEFGKWGQILLNDFNEIDRYLIDAKQLFGNLKDIKELDTWSMNSTEGLTEFQLQYLNFWKSLEKYYNDFTQRLLNKNMAYQGMAYKLVAQHTLEKANKHPWKKIIFAGFNALNKAEEKIIEQLINSQKAEIIWDTDTYYLNDTRQEAGKFIRNYLQRGHFSKNSQEGNNWVISETLLSTQAKKIKVIGAAKNVAQAKLAGNLIEQIKETDSQLQNTALVLADENLLFPVLHSLPPDISDINVTMGYPLKNTPLSGYIDLLFNLHNNAIKLSKGKSKYSFYHKDIINLLSHPYSALLTEEGVAKTQFSLKPVVELIQEKNIVFTSQSTIENLIADKHPSASEKLKPIFAYWQQPDDAFACLSYLIEGLKNNIIARQQHYGDANKTDLELEYLFAFSKILKRLQALKNDYPDSIIDTKTLQTVLKQIVRGTTLPFYGEPLMGLQVMGMLETRTLDFKNIVLLSCNEDILPSGKTSNSFIPFELKRYFGLPTYSDKDAIFAYHFYRLMQRAENIYILYNTETDALGSGEKSRFLTQLMHELPKVNAAAEIEETVVSIPVTIVGSENDIVVSKTDTVMKKLVMKAEKGFSPSALNVYRNCGLQFYFQAIAGLKEAEEVEETIGADTLGNVIHAVLETLYTPFVGKKLTVTDVKEMKMQAEPLAIEAFENQYSSSEIKYGKNYLTVKVALKFLTNFLDAEVKQLEYLQKSQTPLLLKALELPLETQLNIKGQTVKIHGKADRIDTIGATYRIIDYKTGKADDKELKVTDWEDLSKDAELAKSFQLLTYAWMYQKNNPAIVDNMLSGIITFRELSKGLKTVHVNGIDKLNTDNLNDFENQLTHLLEDIMNPEMEFKQTTDIENCKYCSFKTICNR